MPKYLIERELPKAGQLTPAELQTIAAASCKVLCDLGPEIIWVHSYVTEDKIYCVYIAPNKKMIMEHAKKGQFPCNVITEVSAMIDAATAE